MATPKSALVRDGTARDDNARFNGIVGNENVTISVLIENRARRACPALSVIES
jgi:hypothetical protein